MTYAIPRNYVRPTRDFPARRRSARHRPKRTNPARTIANIFVPMGNIGGQGRGAEREGRVGRPQGPIGGRGLKSWKGRKERGRIGTATRRGIDGTKDNYAGEDDG